MRMLDALRGALWDLVCEGLFAHYRTSAGIAERHLALSPGARVIDVGGGTGGVAERLARSGRRVLVVEPGASLVAAGARRRRGVRFVQGRAEALPAADGGVDAVLFIEVLHHVPDADGALREAARVLRPGGRLLIEETEFAGSLGRTLRYRAELLLTNGVWPRDRADIDRRLRAAGLEVTFLEDEGFVILARRP